MCGSGTTNIEAALLGINSVACDISPFCKLMTEIKYESLRIKVKELENFKINTNELFNLFSRTNESLLKDKYSIEEFRIINLARLAYLDAMGYAKRISKSHKELFAKVLNRYFEIVGAFIKNPYFNSKELGKVSIHHYSEALDLKIQSRTIDAIITSPPYSFAIDYMAYQ